MALYFSAGVVPVKKTDKGTQYLMLRSYSYWDFPKGKLEPGESHLDAALRETEEESGLDDFDFVWGRIFKETEPYSTKVKGKQSKKISRYYIALVKSGEPNIRENEETGIKEHDEFRWVSWEEAQKMSLHPRIQEVMKWAHDITERK